jgi:nicotinamide-nucleotide amidase
MPGVPFEMKGIMQQYVLPRMMDRLHKVIIHRTIHTEGIGESILAARIESWENALPPFIKLAYLPQPGIVRLRMSASGDDQAELQQAVANAENELLKIAGNYIFGYDDDTLEELVGNLLRRQGKTLSTAESCTGGNIARAITSVPGSSEYFKGGVVAYSNDIKEKVAGVKHQTLLEYGAVSELTVIEMAEGIKKAFSTDCSIAVSGIAGPDGGSSEKPVGTTWIAVSTPAGTVTAKYLFGEHRGRNIQKATIAALNMLRKELK